MIDMITERLMTRQNDHFAPRIGFRVFRLDDGLMLDCFTNLVGVDCPGNYLVETTINGD
jgi:hypothetical protein